MTLETCRSFLWQKRRVWGPSRWRHGLALAILVGTVFVASATMAQAQTPPRDPMDALGIIPAHGSFSQFPFEHIDVFTGNVVLSFVDLVLPGAAGFNLAIQRTWNVNDDAFGWRFAVAPTLHIDFGPSRSAGGSLTLPDGSALTLIPTPQAGVYMTNAQFWRVTITAEEKKAESPNGVVWRFTSITPMDWVATQMTDAYGNLVDVGWDLTNRVMTRIEQHVGSETRVVEFTRNGTLVSSMSFNGRTWHYTYDATYPFAPHEVQPPEGPSWWFELTGGTPPAWGASTWQGQSRRVTVTLPSGGWVRYESSGYWSCGWVTDCTPPSTNPEWTGSCETTENSCHWEDRPKLRIRTSGEAGATTHTWTFGYEFPCTEIGTNTNIFDCEQRTTILGPEYYARFTHAKPVNSDIWDPPVREILRGTASDQVLERTTFDWRRLRQWPTGYEGGVPNWGYYYRDFVPTAVETVRQGRTYRRQYEYDNAFNEGEIAHFGQPNWITETGDGADRTTQFTYRSFTAGVYLADKVAHATVSANGDSSTSSLLYTDAGFAWSATVDGVTTTYAQDAVGNLASQTDANSHVTTFDYLWGAVSAVHTPAYSTTFTINAFGETTATTQRGLTTTFTFDGAGRPRVVHPPIGHDTVTTYAADGSWIKVARGDSWTTTFLDGFGRPVRTENSQGVQTATGYDAQGRTAWVRAPWDSAHTADRRTTFAYDALDRVILKTNPDASTVGYAFDSVSGSNGGMRTTITDEEGHVTRQLWQGVGSPAAAQLVAVTDATDHTTSYTYDVLGALRQVSSPGGVTRTWTYNTQHRLDEQTQPELGTVHYGYDPVGNLAWQTDAKNQTTTYTYDANNRLIQVTAPDPDTPNSTTATTMTYDASNNRRTLTTNAVATTFDYDAANRLTSRTDVVNGHTFVTGFTPNEYGNVADVEYPSGHHVQYGYDSEQRLSRVFDDTRGLTFARDFAYHPTGGLEAYRSGDDVVHTTTFDVRQRPQHLFASGLPNLPDWTYSYDHVGNVLSIVDSREGKSATFGYDALDRLTTATGGGWGALTYAYDPLGNRTQTIHDAQTTTYAYASQRLTSTAGADVASFGYDPNGNQTQDPLGTYAYTPTNMLRRATMAAGVVHTYTYDGDNQRILKQTGGQTTTYAIGGSGQVLSEFTETGGQLAWSLDYLYAGSRLLGAARPSSTLTVTFAGPGMGIVTGGSGTVTCNWVQCGATFTRGETVTLTAVPAPWSLFAGWSGACSGTGASTTVLVDADRICVATFTTGGAAPAPTVAKVTPLSGAPGLDATVTLRWSSTLDETASYWVCWDSTDNGTCDASWLPSAGLRTRVLEGLAPGTYYWQVRAWTPNGYIEANGGTWFHFTVETPTAGAPGEFSKGTPASDATDQGTSVTLTWSASAGATDYEYCVSPTSQPACTTWASASGLTTASVTGLTAGTTYAWQVRAWNSVGTHVADGGTWWTLTVAGAAPPETPPAAFTKTTPTSGATGQPTSVTLTWASSAGASSYAYCLATTNNTSCDTTWQSAGSATTATVANLTPDGVYFWQVRAQNGVGTTEATGGPWMFTVATPPPPPVTKSSPANGPTGVGRSVTLSWSTTLTAPNHWVCWDTSNNGTCNFMWWPTGTTPSHTLTGLASGTYYWQVRADAGSGPIEGDGGTWWAFTVAPPPTAVTVVPWGTTQTWIRWENEADDMTDFHVERSTDGGAWSEIVQQGARSYLDASPTCGPVAYRVRAHWHGTNQFSEYGNVASVRACAPLAPGPLAVASWYGGTLRLTWEDRSGDESDFHIERQVDGGAWQAVVTLGADSQAWVDEAPPCGVVGYRVRTHRHDSNQYSDFTNVASITRSCFDAATGMSVVGANAGRGGGPPIGRTSAAAWLVLVALSGLTLTGWRRRFRPARRVATLALVAWLALLWPAAAAAQSAIEYYHTDALGSVRAVTKQLNGQWQVVSRHDYMPFGEEVAPASPPPMDKRLFTGKERDQETGLDYFEARYLRAGNGRFSTIDPIIFINDGLVDPQKWNRYSYVGNNPLRFVDPLGLFMWAPSGCGEKDSACQSEYAKNQQSFRSALTGLQKAAMAFPEGSYERTMLLDSLAAYGEEDIPNGVTVGFGPLTQGAAARTLPDGQGHYRVVFDPGAIGIGEYWAVHAGHEGRHIADFRLPASQLLLLDRFSLEYRAYSVSSHAAQGLRLPTLAYAPVGVEIWSSGWSAGRRETLREDAIARQVALAHGWPIPARPWDPLRK